MTSTAAATDAARPGGAAPAGWYLYAIFGADGASPGWRDAMERDVAGLFFVESDGLFAAVSHVPDELAAIASSLGGADVLPPAELGSPSVAVLEDAVRAHERVVEKIFERASLLPLRLGTIFRSVADIEQMLRSHADDLRAQLVEVRDRREWGLRISWARSAAETHASSRLGADPSADAAQGPGHSYLSARRREREGASALALTCGERARELESSLGAVAPGCCTSGIVSVDERAGVSPSLVILEGAFLVARHEEDRFFSLLQCEVDAVEGLSVAVSGPWPPYSFVRTVEIS